MNAAPTELPAQPFDLRGCALARLLLPLALARLMLWLARLLLRLARALLRLAGWRVDFHGLPTAQGVAVVYPHTANWDFVVQMQAKGSIGLPVTFWGKASLFRIPLFGAWLRVMGGLPVLRHTPQGAVARMKTEMQAACAQGRFMWLGLSPECTRQRTEGWRSGCYRVAQQSGVPVALVALDSSQRRVCFDSFWRLCGEPAADFAVFARRLSGTRGRHPQCAAPVRLLEG